MKTIQEMTQALEELVESRPCASCEACNYRDKTLEENYGCMDALFRDILTVFHRLFPRRITYRELFSRLDDRVTRDGNFWFEIKGNPEVLPAFVGIGGENGALIVTPAGNTVVKREQDNILYRFWTERPGKDQQEGEPWDE